MNFIAKLSLDFFFAEIGIALYSLLKLFFILSMLFRNFSL